MARSSAAVLIAIGISVGGPILAEKGAGMKVSTEYRKRFLVRHLQKFFSIRVNQVAYFFTNGRLSFLVTTDNKRYIVDYTMDQLESLNNPEQFFRINRSIIVAFDAVKQAEEYHGNRLIIDIQPVFQEKVIVSRERVAAFKMWLGK